MHIHNFTSFQSNYSTREGDTKEKQMKKIKELIKNRLKEVLTVPHKDDVDEQLRSHAVKTYISSIMMIEDYMKEEQTNKYLINRIDLNR